MFISFRIYTRRSGISCFLFDILSLPYVKGVPSLIRFAKGCTAKFLQKLYLVSHCWAPLLPYVLIRFIGCGGNVRWKYNWFGIKIITFTLTLYSISVRNDCFVFLNEYGRFCSFSPLWPVHSLRPPPPHPSTSSLGGLTPVLSHFTTCERAGSWFWVARRLSLALTSSIFTDWIRVASLLSLTDASSSKGRRDSPSALPCNWPGLCSTSKSKSLSRSSHLATWLLGFFKFSSHGKALRSVLARRCWP